MSGSRRVELWQWLLLLLPHVQRRVDCTIAPSCSSIAMQVIADLCSYSTAQHSTLPLLPISLIASPPHRGPTLAVTPRPHPTLAVTPTYSPPAPSPSASGSSSWTPPHQGGGSRTRR
jgi:hypothetical protein